MKLNLESSAYSFEASEKDAPVTIGRGDDCKFIVDEADVSRKHAEFHYEDGDWYITDLNSRHGTRVNGHSITERTKIKDGDVIRISKQNLIASLAKEDELADMEKLGAKLAGGQLREIIKTATDKKAKAPAKSPLAQKRKKVEETANDSDAESKSEKSEQAEDDSDTENVPEKKTGAKRAGPVLRKAQPKKSSPIKSLITFVICLGIIGGGGYFAWEYNEKQKQQQAPVQPVQGTEAAPLAKPTDAPIAKPAKVEEVKDSPAPADKPADQEKPAADKPPAPESPAAPAASPQAETPAPAAKPETQQ